MRYVSTRGGSAPIGFPEVLLTGLAPDGGLYVPEKWPQFSEPSSSYAQTLAGVLALFVGGAIGDLPALAAEAVADFSQPDITSLRQVEAHLYLLELFWGPSLAFKDLGLQTLARLFERVGRPVTIIGATSGDTGAASVQAFKGRSGVTLVVFHPAGRISEVQRRQMTTVADPNVVNVAVEGTFDDCQALVKRLLSELGPDVGLATANSINWVRIAAQTTYYFVAASRLDAPVVFAVPSGNFGNAYSAYAARRMGLSMGPISVATNANRGLADLLQTGTLRAGIAIPTSTPAMDIQVPSNLERALFEAYEREPAPVIQSMRSLTETGALTLTRPAWERLQRDYRGEAVTEDETRAEMTRFHRDHGHLIDPHTAVALAVGRRHRVPGRAMVIVATAHPAKFPDAVARATGVLPALPERLARLFELPERIVHIANDYEAARTIVVRAAKTAG